MVYPKHTHTHERKKRKEKKEGGSTELSEEWWNDVRQAGPEKEEQPTRTRRTVITQKRTNGKTTDEKREHTKLTCKDKRMNERERKERDRTLLCRRGDRTPLERVLGRRKKRERERQMEREREEGVPAWPIDIYF